MTVPRTAVALALESGGALAEVESLLARSSDGQDLSVYARGGKRLRARLALLPAAALRGSVGEPAIRYAAFVELIHAATLCHDDVVDRSERRRGQPTLMAAGGPRAATMAGLRLMWRAYALIADEPPAVREMVAQAAAQVARGQAEELTDLWLEVDVDTYLARQRQKTGALFELAAWLGATAAGLERGDVAAYRRFALQCGLAFQVADDLRDFAGAPDLGREPGTDLREGVLTLPVLLALRRPEAVAPLRAAFEQVRDSRDVVSVARCRQLVLDCGVFEDAEEMVLDLWERARAGTDGIAAAPVRRAARQFVRVAASRLAWNRPASRRGR